MTSTGFPLWKVLSVNQKHNVMRYSPFLPLFRTCTTHLVYSNGLLRFHLTLPTVHNILCTYCILHESPQTLMDIENSLVVLIERSCFLWFSYKELIILFCDNQCNYVECSCLLLSSFGFQVNVVDGLFFKPFSKWFERNLRAQRPVERHVSYMKKQKLY